MLSLRVRYRQFEPAYALFGRLALRYGFRDILLFGAQVRLHFPYLSTARAVPIIAEMAGFDAATLLSWSPVPHNKGFVFRESSFHSNMWNLRSNRRICPQCLRDDYENDPDRSNLSLFRRFWWDCQEIDVCPTHQAVLIDKCPACQHPLEARSADMRHCACGFDFLRTRTTESILQDVVSADRYLLDRLMNVHHEVTSPLDTLTIQNVMLVIRNVGMSWIAIHEGEWLDRRDKQSRLRIKAAGFASFFEWPQPFRQLLDSAANMTRSNERKLITGPYRAYGDLYRWFRLKAANEFAPITDEIERHFRVTVACHSTQHVFGRKLDDSNYVTLSYANRYCGLSINSRYIISFLKFLGYTLLDKRNSTKVQIRRKDLPRLKALIEHSIPLREAAKRLGVDRTTVRHLVESWSSGREEECSWERRVHL